MFTGLIEATGRLVEREATGGGLRLRIASALADELDPPTSGQREPHLRPVTAVPQQPEAPAGPRSGSAGARLLATQMAVSGSSREEIAERLSSGFDIADTSEILDAILGPEES